MTHGTGSHLVSVSSADLRGILYTCSMGGRWHAYDHVVPQIFQILEERGEVIPEEISASWQAYLNADKEQIVPSDFLVLY